MKIKDYIEASRKTIIDAKAKLYENNLACMYSTIFSTLKAEIGVELAIYLEIAYSTNKTAETVFDIDNKAYLIYDQYLGQYLNMMNRLFFNSKEAEETIKYSFKLLAEELQLEGYPQIALICAGAHVLEDNELRTYTKDVNPDLRATYTFIQESFVIAHELAHYIWSRINKNQSLEVFRETLILMLREKYSGPLSDEDVHAYLQDGHILLYDENTSYKDFLTEEQINNIKSDMQNTQTESMQELIDIAQNDEKLMEEIFCDEVALNMLLKILPKKYNINKSDIVNSVYIGMMNLRILGIINQYVSKFRNQASISKKFLNTSMLRLMRYRDKATYYYSEMHNISGGHEEVHNILTKTNIRYSEIIGDPVLFLLPERILKLEEIVKSLPPLSFDDFLDSNNKIDYLLRNKKQSYPK
jgi:6-pyruvoyl-tetrahydropterin synthase